MDAFENQGKFLIMDMGVGGAKELKETYRNGIFIYIIPPSQERLLEQMDGRGPERIARNRRQLSRVKGVCNWLIINDDLNTAVDEIQRLMHIIKEHPPGYEGVDEDTMRFLYDRNFQNEKNIAFLDGFYHTITRPQEEI